VLKNAVTVFFFSPPRAHELPPQTRASLLRYSDRKQFRGGEKKVISLERRAKSSGEFFLLREARVGEHEGGIPALGFGFVA
jgi:hypothetical protein